MYKEKVENKPARLHKKEPITLNYDVATVYLTGTIFIIGLVALAFSIGTENFSSLLWSCI